MSSTLFSSATAALALLSAGSAHCADQVQSLCTSSEKVFLSCKTKTGKTLSVCGSPSLSSSAGYVQYRYGTAKTIDLKFPESDSHSQLAFRWRTDRHQGVEANWLIFYRSNYKYTVFAIHDANTPNGELVHRHGVIVTDPKEAEVTIPCLGEVASSFEQLAGVLPEARDDE